MMKFMFGERAIILNIRNHIIKDITVDLIIEQQVGINYIKKFQIGRLGGTEGNYIMVVSTRRYLITGGV